MNNNCVLFSDFREDTSGQQIDEIYIYIYTAILKYFREVTSGQQLDKVDISVHCDIKIF